MECAPITEEQKLPLSEDTAWWDNMQAFLTSDRANYWRGHLQSYIQLYRPSTMAEDVRTSDCICTMS